ncbi:MAG: alpha/beta hydrolase-fold protein [Cyclobacteriaceae bacterium]
MHSKSTYLGLTLILLALSAVGFTDESHYSSTFKAIRYFRVFTPLDYDQENTKKRYDVIYYFHGCGGSYRKSGTYNYQDFGLTPPEAIDREDHPDYDYPNNADLENEAQQKDVIIISVNGKIPGIPGCGVYFPSQVDGWEGNWYNFSMYIRELIEVVDQRYNTLVGPQHRAISGLSMGGQAATWIAATNPHLFSSASEFGYSPAYYEVGPPAYQTTIDIHQLWRNFRGLPMRHSTNNRDYLKYYTTQLYHMFEGAGFDNEFYLADFCMHHAARMDLQFAFQQQYFTKPKMDPACFSFLNLYPDFEVWGYQVKSEKVGNGWIYLHDVTKNGLGVYTRQRLPWGKSLSSFDIHLTTPALYAPGKAYTLSRYAYSTGKISSTTISADESGRLIIRSEGGMGDEFGLEGEGLPPPVLVLTDTINEDLYLDAGQPKTFSMDVVNLSSKDQKVKFEVSTDNNDLLSITKQPGEVIIPALSKVSIGSFFTCVGANADDFKNTGFIRISSSIDGVVQDRVQYRKVVVKRNANPEPKDFEVMVFDGRTKELPLYQYQWNGWNDPFSPDSISEGMGNGDGKPDVGEVFSIWIKTPSPLEEQDQQTWHPVIPLNGKDAPDIHVEEILQTRRNTGRSSPSAQLRLLRRPTKEEPVKIPVKVEFLQAEYLEDDCHRNTADKFGYGYYDLVLTEDGSIRLEKGTE